MPKVYRSPLSGEELDALEAMSKKANAHGQTEKCSPLYVAIDAGDSRHRDGWLFVAWPALNSRSAHCARLIFDYIGDVVMTEFGAVMVPTEPQEAPDAPRG
jgi:hypothetical protein